MRRLRPSPYPIRCAFDFLRLVVTYLPVPPCGLPVHLGVVGQVPVPVHDLAAVAGGPPRELTQVRNAEQAREAATRLYHPLVVVRLAGGRSLDRVGARRVLGRAQDGGHVERAHLAAVVILWRCRRGTTRGAEGGDLIRLLESRLRASSFLLW